MAYKEILENLEKRFPERIVITTKEVSILLSCSPQVIRNMHICGELIGVKMGGGIKSPIKFRLPVLARWLVENEAKDSKDHSGGG